MGHNYFAFFPRPITVLHAPQFILMCHRVPQVTRICVEATWKPMKKANISTG